jgi:nucleotide-binding universal stress UspA family protein
VQWAAEEAVRRGVPLVLVHAWIYPAYAASPYAYPIGPDIEVVRDAAKKELADAIQAAKDRHPGLEVDGILAEDTPGHQLVDQSVGATMLVVGSHHRGRLSEFLGLSVSATCAQRADCPVVIVPCAA